MQALRADTQGQVLVVLLPAILVIVGVAMIAFGVITATSGAIGSGLMWVGAGIIVGDFGGFVVVKHPMILIGGGAGFVILLIGAGVSAFLGR